MVNSFKSNPLPKFGQAKPDNDPCRDDKDFIVPEDDHEILYRPADNFKYFAVARKKPDPVTGQVYYHYVYRPNSDTYVGVVPTVMKPGADGKPEEHVVLIETQRGVGKVNRIIELAGGDVDNLHGSDMLNPDNVAKAELAEEVQLASNDLKSVPGRPTVVMEPGLARKFANYYLARNATSIKDPGVDDPNERLTIRKQHTVPVSQVMSWLKTKSEAGYGIANIVYAGLLYLMDDMELIKQKH